VNKAITEKMISELKLVAIVAVSQSYVTASSLRTAVCDHPSAVRPAGGE